MPWMKRYDLRVLIMLIFGKIWDRIYWGIRTLSWRCLVRGVCERSHFVAQIGNTGRVIGFVLTKYKGGDFSATWGLHMLSVDPEFRRRGIGTMLAKRVIRHAKQKGAKFLFLSVRKKNVPALNLYKQLGFKLGRGDPCLAYMFLKLNRRGV